MLAILCFGAAFLALWGVTFSLFPPLVRGIRGAVGRLARFLRAQERFAPWMGHVDARRSYVPLVVAFAVGTLVLFVAADAFTDLAAALKAKSPAVQRIDTDVWEWFGSHRSPAATALFTAVTLAGGPVGLGGLVLAVLVALLARRRFRWAAYLAITAAGGTALNQVLKFHYVRQRPDLEAAVLGAMGYSFPSGHAMGATIVLGALGYLTARSVREWSRKSAAFSAFATLALAIGISRLYLGVHWASDVAGGFAAGALWVTSTTTGYELFRQYSLGRRKGRAGPLP